ncbi:Alpha/Beta hydrolase protein [Haematococcus lacustris]
MVRSSSAPSAQQAKEDEIDPLTGQPIAKYMAISPKAGLKANVAGTSWAYRRSEVNPDKASTSKPVVLLVHGLGSSSFSYRNTLGLLGADGYDAVAPDWPGHGDSDKPSSFNYSEEGMVAALDAFVAQTCGQQPVALVVQGYVLSQYALLWAQQNERKVSRLLILNTPLSTNSKLRPELAAYKTPLAFMRPKTFDGMMFNATGSAYVMEGRVADAYARPYADPAASAAVASVMEKCDYGKLLKKVNEGFMTWKKPSVLMFGGSDPFLSVASAFEFLEDKRTNMKIISAAAKLGHCPQEDFAEALHETMLPWLAGTTDEWTSGKTMKMTKYGGVEV